MVAYTLAPFGSYPTTRAAYFQVFRPVTPAPLPPNTHGNPGDFDDITYPTYVSQTTVAAGAPDPYAGVVGTFYSPARPTDYPWHGSINSTSYPVTGGSADGQAPDPGTLTPLFTEYVTGEYTRVLITSKASYGRNNGGGTWTWFLHQNFVNDDFFNTWNWDYPIADSDVVVSPDTEATFPLIKAWTYTLDGHDYYVLRLKDLETLVCDLSTGQWMVFGSGDVNRWRAVVGQNWLGAGGQAATYNSNILVGDSTIGTLYFLDPTAPFDDDPQYGYGLRGAFTRVVSAQIPLRTPDWVPCYGIGVYGSFGETTRDYTISLSTSDDSGHTWVAQGDVAAPTGDFTHRTEWRSLGSMTAPGRLIQVTDIGAFTRVDGLEFLEDAG